MNKAPLNCVLRVGGIDLDIDAITAGTTMKPYRTERTGIGRAKSNGLWYNVSDNDLVTSEDLSSAIQIFIAKNGRDLSILREAKGVEYIDFDVALWIDEGMIMRSLSLDPPVLAAMAAAGIYYTVSSYGVFEADS